MRTIVTVLVLLSSLNPAATSLAQEQPRSGGPSSEYNGITPRAVAAQPATDRIIVKWRSGDSKVATAAARARQASAAVGTTLQHQQKMTADIDLMQVPQPLAGAELQAMIEQLQADPAVEYAAADMRRYPHALTSDPILLDQWYLLGDQPSATQSFLAWDTTIGSSTTVVAVLDTGVRYEHPDLLSASQGGKLLPGYDFITSPLVANDGDGPDPDASDPGDFISAADLQNSFFARCGSGPNNDQPTASSWHGTRVSGLIGALTDNGIGVAGGDWNTLILPLRVLGKCGGSDSDIARAMLWAAGISVPGFPDNPTPANIINLSLGAVSTCSPVYVDTINAVNARGVLVVASAGNEGGPVASPANCPGVVAVAGLRHVGTKVGFSSLGTEVDIGAPGGNCVNTQIGADCLFSIIAPTNLGLTVPADSGFTDKQNFNVGTSFSAPLVAAAAALMRSVNTALTPAQFTQLLKESASPFPTSSTPGVGNCRIPTSTNDLQTGECNCTTSTCGAGMLNTNAAVSAAVRPLAIFSSSGTATTGATLSFDGSASFASNGRSLVSFQWSIQNLSGSAPTIMTPNEATTTVQITGDSSFTMRLTVADDQGGVDTQDFAVATPAPATSGGGGGGSFGWELLGLLLLIAARRNIRFSASPRSGLAK